MVTKVEAARIAHRRHPRRPHRRPARLDALTGKPTGTFFHRTGVRGADRLLWLAPRHHRARPPRPRRRRRRRRRRRAQILSRRASPPSKRGFTAGDPVDLVDENGNIIARGLVNFDAKELPGLLGRSTHELAREMGPAYESARSSTATTWCCCAADVGDTGAAPCRPGGPPQAAGRALRVTDGRRTGAGTWQGAALGGRTIRAVGR
ncbi:PUA domain-containing protein [Yinghuangia aomiensis]